MLSMNSVEMLQNLFSCPGGTENCEGIEAVKNNNNRNVNTLKI